MKFPLLATLFLSCFLVEVSTAASLEEKITAFEKAVQTEMAVRKDVPKGGSDDFRMGAFNGDGLRRQIASGELGLAERAIRSLMVALNSDEVQKSGLQILEELKQRRFGKSQAWQEQAEAILKKSKEIIPTAKKPEDLDELIAQLEQIKSRPFIGGYEGSFYGDNERTTELRELSEQVQKIQQFATTWQQYLSSLNNNQYEQASRALGDLLNYNYSYLCGIPRSGILARREELAKKDNTNLPKTVPARQKDAAEIGIEIVDEIRSLDEMSAALERLKTLPNNQTTQSLAAWLRICLDSYKSITKGEAVAFDLSLLVGRPVRMEVSAYGQPLSSTLNAGDFLKDQMLLFLLRNYFERGEKKFPKETSRIYLGRILTRAAEAKERKEMLKALRVTDYVERRLAFPPPNMYGPNSVSVINSSVSQLINALNADEAAQPIIAYTNYQSALTSNYEYLPAKYIGERIAALGAELKERRPPVLPYINPTGYGATQSVAETFVLNIPALSQKEGSSE